MPVLVFYRWMAQQKTWQVLNREVTELQCQESKWQAVLDVVTRAVVRVIDDDPPKAIELAETPPPPEVKKEIKHS